MNVRHVTFILIIFSAIVAAAGCSDSNPTNSFEPEVLNNTDDFSFRVSNAYRVTTTLRYNWTNTGEQATIYHSTTRTEGRATLVIVDVDNNQVYSEELLPSATEISLVGRSGTWGIAVVFEGYTGNCGFRVQKL